MTKRLSNLQIATIYILLLLNFPSFGQTPCSGGMAGSYPCDDVDLQSHLPLSTFSASAGNDIWGWVGTDGKEYAIVGVNNGTAFVDVTNATSPIYIGKLPKTAGASNSSWKDIKVINNHAYIGTESNNQHIQIFDLTKLVTATGVPVTFSDDGSASIGDGSTHNIVANTDAGYICGVGANESSGGLVFYDLADPENPVKTGGFSTAGYSHDAVCVIYRGPDTQYIGQEICIGLNASKFDIVDVTDKSNFDWISNTTYTSTGYTHQGWITDDHKYLIFGDELDEWNNLISKRKTFVYDISDLDNPAVETTFLGLTKAIDHNQYVKGNYLYQANYREGMQIWDISDMTNINQVGSFDIYPANNSTQFDGAWSIYPYFKSGNIIINGIGEGLFVVDPDLPHYVMEHLSGPVQTVCQGTDANFTIDLTDYDNFGSNVNLTLTGVPGGGGHSFSTNPVSPDGLVTITISNTNLILPGKYHLLLEGNGTPAQKLAMGLIVNPVPTSADLTAPSNGTTNTGMLVTFTWANATQADSYKIDIATGAGMEHVVLSQSSLSFETYSTDELAENTSYSWRVYAENECSSVGSVVSSFATGAVLPIELIDFKAKPLSNSIRLNWETATELQNEGFEIQRYIANEPTDFEKIAWVDGNGNSQQTNRYEFEDTNVEFNVEYFYRLRQVDFDGKASFSEIVAAKIDRIASGITVFPNPAKDILSISFNAPSNSINHSRMTISNINGGILMQRNVDLSQESEYELDVSGFNSGVYTIQFFVEGTAYVKRFIKM